MFHQKIGLSKIILGRNRRCFTSYPRPTHDPVAPPANHPAPSKGGGQSKRAKRSGGWLHLNPFIWNSFWFLWSFPVGCKWVSEWAKQRLYTLYTLTSVTPQHLFNLDLRIYTIHPSQFFTPLHPTLATPHGENSNRRIFFCPSISSV